MTPPPINGAKTGTAVHATQYPQQKVPEQPKPVTVTVTHSDHKNNSKVPPQVFEARTAIDRKNGFTVGVPLPNGKTYFFKDCEKTTNLKVALLLDKSDHKLNAKVSPIAPAPVKTSPTFQNGTDGGRLKQLQSKTANQPKPTGQFMGISYYGPLGVEPGKGQGVNLAPKKLQNDIAQFKSKTPPPFQFSRSYTPHSGPSMRLAAKEQPQQHQPLVITSTRSGDPDYRNT